MDSATNDLPSLGLQIGAGGAKSATALGLRSVGIQVVTCLFGCLINFYNYSMFNLKIFYSCRVVIRSTKME